jgi:hypothetical protein
MIEAGKMTDEEWPRYNSKGRGKKPDNGQLPINHSKIKFLADKGQRTQDTGHRVRGYAKKFFTLAALCKEKNLGCTKLDAERMKRRTSWALRIAAKGTFDEFEIALTAVLEHHFDNYAHCGGWCKAKGKTGEEKKKSSLRFRSKTKNAEIYEHDFKVFHVEFMEKDQPLYLFYCWDTNAVEGGSTNSSQSFYPRIELTAKRLRTLSGSTLPCAC